MAYDALTSDRPYRAAWSREKALARIRDGAGRQFDPRLVEAGLFHRPPARCYNGGVPWAGSRGAFVRMGMFPGGSR